MENSHVSSPFNSLQQRRETACSAPEGDGRGGRGRQGGQGKGEIKNVFLCQIQEAVFLKIINAINSNLRKVKMQSSRNFTENKKKSE